MHLGKTQKGVYRLSQIAGRTPRGQNRLCSIWDNLTSFGALNQRVLQTQGLPDVLGLLVLHPYDLAM